MTDTTDIMGVEELRDLRKQVLAGREITDEEIKRVMTTLRADRAKIGAAKSKTTTGRARQPIDLGSLFGDKK